MIDTEEMSETTSMLYNRIPYRNILTPSLLCVLGHSSHRISHQVFRLWIFLQTSQVPARHINLPNIGNSPYPYSGTPQNVVLVTQYVQSSTQHIQSSMTSVYAPALENVLCGLADSLMIFALLSSDAMERAPHRYLFRRMVRNRVCKERIKPPRGCGRRVMHFCECGGIDRSLVEYICRYAVKPGPRGEVGSSFPFLLW